MEGKKYTIDILEWKHFYPLKKGMAVLLMVIWCLYLIFTIATEASGRLIESLADEGTTLYAFISGFILMTLIIWYAFQRMFRFPYLSIPGTSRYFTRRKLKEMLRDEIFYPVTVIKNDTRVLQSEHWLYYDGRIIPKKFVCGYRNCTPFYGSGSGVVYHKTVGLYLITGEFIRCKTKLYDHGVLDFTEEIVRNNYPRINTTGIRKVIQEEQARNAHLKKLGKDSEDMIGIICS